MFRVESFRFTVQDKPKPKILRWVYIPSMEGMVTRKRSDPQALSVEA